MPGFLIASTDVLPHLSTKLEDTDSDCWGMNIASLTQPLAVKRVSTITIIGATILILTGGAILKRSTGHISLKTRGTPKKGLMSSTTPTL